MPRTHRLDLIGQSFGRWTVLSISHKNKYGEIFWLCRCACGTERPVVARSLRRGISVSCGCTAKDWCRTHGMEGSSTYNVWAGMIQRCHNVKSRGFIKYRSRGISVCQKWRDSFEAFLGDMGERPSGKTLDRINNAGNYEPANCRWATYKQQSNNRRVTTMLTLDGKTLPLTEWASVRGVSARLLQHRVDAGWSDEDTLTKPVDVRFSRKKREIA